MSDAPPLSEFERLQARIVDHARRFGGVDGLATTVPTLSNTVNEPDWPTLVSALELLVKDGRIAVRRWIEDAAQPSGWRHETFRLGTSLHDFVHREFRIHVEPEGVAWLSSAAARRGTTDSETPSPREPFRLVAVDRSAASELQLDRILTKGRHQMPQGTQVAVALGALPGHVRIQLRLPGATSMTDLGELPISGGAVRLPLPLAFLSYAREDMTTVRALAVRLREHGALVWMDRDRLLPGDDWRRAIDEAIETADFVLVCLSPSACTKTGEVQREIRYALKQAELRPRSKRYLIPVIVSPCAPPREFRDLQWCDLQADDGFAKLVAALRS